MKSEKLLETSKVTGKVTDRLADRFAAGHPASKFNLLLSQSNGKLLSYGI